MNEGLDVFNNINKGLKGFMEEKGFNSIKEMIGLAHGDKNG